MEFNNDIFISYAHIDNQPLEKDTDGWVSQFHHALEVRVDQLLGKKSSIWRDLKLEGNDCFDDMIIDQLPGVGVLVSVLSPRYVHSDWCVRELNAFCEASTQSGGLRLGDKTRIFKVLKTPVPIEEHPQGIRNVLGYEFFIIDPDTGRARELNKVFGGEAERAFWFKLDDLAQDLCNLLHQLEHGPAPAMLQAESQDAVFVASASFDIKEHYEEIRRDLIGHNVRVLPDQPLPTNSNELIPFLRDMLKQCRMSIHPVGKLYDVVPLGADRSLMAMENELAIEREVQGNFCRLVWIPSGLQVEDENQRRFVESLRSDPRIQYGGDLLETPLEDLKTQIHEILRKTKESQAKVEKNREAVVVSEAAPSTVAPTPTPPVDSGQTIASPQVSEASHQIEAQSDAGAAQTPGVDHDMDELQCVYLICDSPDFDQVTEVADCLFDRGYEVILPALEGDEAEVREDHEDNLCRCDAVLIYYATANDLWLRRKLREVRKSAGLGRAEPVKTTAVLVAPPNSTGKQWLRSHEALVIHQQNGFAAELLDPFLAELHP